MSNDNKLSKYMRSEAVVERFREVLGQKNTGAYITSALIAVASSDALKACEPQSIVASALRAASLRLSVDPSGGQAYLVPFKGKATLIVGYKGLHDMAVRTKQYRYINVTPIRQGESVIEDRITGFHSIEGAPVADGATIGWLGAFQLFTGYAKTYYMTVEEIHDHAKKYSKSYDRTDSAWKTDTAKMERKTVLRLMLRQWGYLDPLDAGILSDMEDAGEDEGGIIEAQFLPSFEEVIAAQAERDEQVEPKTETQLKAELGFSSTSALAVEVFEDQEEKLADPADAFWKAVKSVGLLTEDGAAILKENNNDFAKALTIVQTQHTPPAEETEAVPA